MGRFSFQRPLWAVSLLLAELIAPARAQGDEARIWSDKSGKYEIRAKLIDVVDGQVRLERPNGDITRVPLEKLSEADQEYVRSFGTGEPARPVEPATPQVRSLQVGDRVEAEHFGKWRMGTVTEIDYELDRVQVQIEGESDHDWGMSLDELRYPGTLQRPLLIPPASPVGNMQTVRPNYDNMRRMLADDEPAHKIAAERLPASTAAWQPRAVRLGSGNGGPLLPSDLAIAAPPAALALVVYDGFHRDDEIPLVELVDLNQRQVLLTGPAPSGTGKGLISPSGTCIATTPSEKNRSESRGQVDFWRVADKKFTHWISFSPYVMNTWPDLDPEWSEWLDDERFFTLNAEGQLILWDVTNAKAIYDLMISRKALPILTHGRQHLVVPTKFGIQFFDAESGELAAVIGSEDYSDADLALSPSGKQLAAASEGIIDILDVTTGELTRSFPCERTGSRAGISWIDEDYLFTRDGLIIHVPLRMAVWKYEIASLLVRSYAGKHWALLGLPLQGNQVLAPLELPPREAVDAVKNLDEENLLAVRPGDTIKIDVQIQGDNFLAEGVRKALAEALEQAELQVGEESPLTLVARTKPGKTQKIEYHAFGAFHGRGEMMEVTSRVYELQLLLEGVPIWDRQSVQSAPLHLHLQEGETVRAALDRVMAPTAANFRGRLPSYVVRPEYREPLGSSKLSFEL